MDFLPLSSYGFIGNLGSCALVGMNGSIDWCCLPRLDSPSVFGKILDPALGGSFSIAPVEQIERSRQSYISENGILRTQFAVAGGRIEVLDWMHMGDFSIETQEHHRLPAIYRLLRCVEGSVEVQIRFDPRLDYARAATALTPMENGVLASGGEDVVRLHAACPFILSSQGAQARCMLHAGEERSFLCAYGRADQASLPSAEESLRSTMAYWTRWISQCDDDACHALGEWYPYVIRSSIVLKMLTGGQGMAAAATTSLPESLGGADNWDYRFNWIRDSSFTVQALASLGHIHDARMFLEWLSGLLTGAGRRPADLQILYPLYGNLLHPEETLPHLRGYADSRPVRIGNAASHQRQLDIYGEVLEAVYRSKHLHPGVGQRLSHILCDIVDYVCDVWREKDSGIWELRTGTQQYIYSKVMCWVAVDRGIRLAESQGWGKDLSRWQQERDAIRAFVMTEGYSEKRRAFVQHAGGDTLDATALLFPLLEFLPADHPYALSTLDTIQRELAVGPLVYRSSDHVGCEGTFGLCGFWLVDALVLAGRRTQAREHFLALLARRNHVGLFAEEIDAKTGAFLGNFPQAFTHVGLINSALYLSRAEGATPGQPLIGEREMKKKSN
jgi:GH15 family glucan-1,4-alpha-glucosidase